ncbi:YaaL family protein [Dethiothermospora halolimnae]|uniref:YaaL family protein n=1 Tax=Dethiothermospora halolimnae TaxID=3114390 RepID=UPI003CCBF8B0
MENNTLYETLNNKFKSFFSRNNINEQKDDDKDLLYMLNRAHEDWQDAEDYFNNVTESDLIDYAVFKLEATKKRYSYLLKEARKKGIHV